MTNGTRTRSSGPWRIGMPRFSWIRHDLLSSVLPSGNASVRNGSVGCLSERVKKESDGLISFVERPATIVLSSRKVKERLPHWENTCDARKHRNWWTREIGLTCTKSPVVQSQMTKLSTNSFPNAEVKRQPSLFSQITISILQPSLVGSRGISYSRSDFLARGWGLPSESLSR